MANKTELESIGKMLKAAKEYSENLGANIKTLEEASVFFLTAMDHDDLSKKYEAQLRVSIADLKTAYKYALQLTESLANQYKSVKKILEDE